MRSLVALVVVFAVSPAFASELVPREPLPAGIPDRDTPGKPSGGGVRYDYPYVLDAFGRYGILDWCRDWGAACGKPAAEAFCKQVDGGANPRAGDFGQWRGAARYGYTVVISTRDSFELPRGDGFTYIVCRK